MNRLTTILGTLLAAVMLLAACVKEPTIKYEDLEQRSLKAWIEKYRPELVDNYQEDGGYYVEILDEGCLDSLPVTGKDVWLWFDFTGRDLQGNVCESRDWKIAYQQGTYTAYTRYVPAYRFSGAETHSLMEGSYLATFNELNIGGEKFAVRYGTKLRLYLPSAVIDTDNGIKGDGGYEGQFELDGNVPMIFDMTLYGHVANPVAYEGNYVDSFANINGGLCTEHRTIVESGDGSESSSLRRRTTRAEGEEDSEVDTRPLEFYDGRWHQPIDTLAQLYVNYTYSPARQSFDYNAIGADTMMFPNQTTYNNGFTYGSQSLAEIDRRINEALVERFGAGLDVDKLIEADSVKGTSSAHIWYICRFLDGYVCDTNIDEVKEIVFGEVADEGSVLVFNGLDPDDNDYVPAWNYAMPTLRLGQWASILTVSTYAYGIAGKVGSHKSETTSNNAYYDTMNYYNYMNYMNNYYGYGYGNMYNSGYYGYNPYYYGYVPTVSESDTTTVTTTSTEIPAYTPLLFQVYVVAK